MSHASLVIVHEWQFPNLSTLSLTHVLCVSFLELLESGTAVEHGCLHMCICADVYMGGFQSTGMLTSFCMKKN